MPQGLELCGKCEKEDGIHRMMLISVGSKYSKIFERLVRPETVTN